MGRQLVFRAILVVAAAGSVAQPDDLVYRYEGDVLPYDPSAGWLIFDACEGPCSELLANGHFMIEWDVSGDTTNYTYIIAQPPISPPPAPFWLEWAFRSDEPFNGRLETCDAGFSLAFREVSEVLWILGDAVVSFSGDDVRTGLALNEWHTYRFESIDGMNYCFMVDGDLFVCGEDHQGTGYNYLQMLGHGGCNPALHPNFNEWDFVRYGTISYGEQIVTSDPPGGFMDARVHPMLDRFMVTFDQPNYVYIDEINVEVGTLGTEAMGIGHSDDPALAPTDYHSISVAVLIAPTVIATRRLDNGPPEVVEIVLDRPIPYNATTRFTLNDGVSVNTVEYTFTPGDTNGDGDADLFDFAAFQNCFGVSPVAGSCLPLDFNADSAVDILDFAEFQRILTAP